jgi:hypothetical protein
MDQKHTASGGDAAHPPSHDGSHTHAPERGVEHGVPSEAGDAEPMGLPSSDRHHSETAPAEKGGNSDVLKHDHAAPGKHGLARAD